MERNEEVGHPAYDNLQHRTPLLFGRLRRVVRVAHTRLPFTVNLNHGAG